MEDRSELRLALLVVLVLSIAWAGYHRGKAQRAGGSVSRAGEGPWIFALLRLSGLGTWGITIAYLINPASVGFAALPISEALQWVGFVCILAGFAWLAWMFRALGLNVTDTVAARANGTLVTTGPYRIVRHPMYVGLVPILGGLGLVTANWLLVVFGAIAFSTLLVRTRIEERNLIEKYGEAYREYMRTTGGFFPRLRA